jgi:hypothetical protein
MVLTVLAVFDIPAVAMRAISKTIYNLFCRASGAAN